MKTAHSPRHGVALILALVALAALLLLGLPFLFSQSASLASARTVAEREEAHALRTAAESYATSLAVGSLAKLYEPTSAATTDALNGGDLLRLIDPDGIGTGASMRADPSGDSRPTLMQRIAPLLMSPPSPGPLSVPGSVTTAASSDPQQLDLVAGWDALLKKVGIDDWDDR